MFFDVRNHRNAFRILGLALFLFSIVLLAASSLCAQTPLIRPAYKSILVLNSYHPGFDWTDDLVRSITSTLSSDFKHVESYIEYMDAKRFPEEGQALAFLDLLNRKYSGKPLDLIIATDDMALKFLLENGTQLFPGIPVVFCGVSDKELMARVDRSLYTGVHELFGTAQLIRMARQIRPQARQVHLVFDASAANAPFIEVFREELKQDRGFEPVFLLAREIGLGGILERLRNARADSIVIALSFTQDWHSTAVSLEDTMAAIAAASPVPVLSPNISRLGQGILAGNANGGIRHGTFTAGVAAKVLRGVSPAAIPIQPEGGFGPVFDYAAMSRWKISENQLPAESVIVNKPNSVQDAYRKPMLIAGGLIALQMTIIGLLVWNILARRKAENALRQSELQYRDMVENAMDGIYSHDLDGRMTDINGTMAKILGYNRDELLKMSTISLVAPEFHAKVLESTARKVNGERTSPYEVVVLSKDGRKMWIEIRSRLKLRNGKPFGVEGVVRDITERKQLELQLQQAMKMEALGRLAGGVAHDFNNMLTVICGYTKLLQASVTDPKQQERLEQVRLAGEQATQLTRHLLSFTRSQAMEPTVVNLNDVVRDIVKMLRRFIGEDVTIKTNLDPNLRSVMADPSQLGQVVMNLALNARDAMPHGGTLTIETSNRLSSQKSLMQVTDTGVGMDHEVIRRVFDPFFTTKEAGKGTGLGLSVTYRIVTQYGGDITVESEPGKGASFLVSLPSVPGAPASDDKRQDSTIIGGTETVLVVEDRPEVREFAVSILTDSGFRVYSAADAGEALDIVNNNHIGPLHLLLTDVVMPGMTGPELASILTEKIPSLKVVMMSGYTAGTELDGKHGPPLSKPFSPDDLLRRVRSKLDSPLPE